MIWGLVQAYNNESTIDQCLSSLQGQVDRILVADGWFPFNEPPGNGSTDNTESKVKAYPNTQWIPAPATPYESQLAKINAMIRKVPVGIWQFWLDTDEHLVGDLREYHRDLNAEVDAIPMVLRMKNGLEILYARLVKTIPGMTMVKLFTLRYPGYEPTMNLELGRLWKTTYIEHL